ncbi:hypothetical protein QBC34DRAFT_198771 [Podospora aff. communis PSN243]|uniref:Protein kinase domain-containing protein n=1 Tax=Podospora aff. communis PSN243 TaxID=3040156 RepID=A0AAV9G692_9PEZI|nr:hypothetical protein QBC34DRAFT_198771 [Podospora aff. communis PSN243]
MTLRRGAGFIFLPSYLGTMDDPPRHDEGPNGGSVIHLSTQPIYDAAIVCSKHFERQLETIDSTGDDYIAIEELWGRFNQWAAYIGAFAVPRASLDARLVRHSEIRDMVLELLFTIQENLLWVNAHDNTEEASESSPGLPAVGAAVDRLLLLSVNIRRSARQAHRLRHGSRRNPHDESLCSRLAQARFPNARKSLCSQLGASIHGRGISLQYMKEHNEKLAYRRSDEVDKRDGETKEETPKEQETAPVLLFKKDTSPRPQIARGPETLPSLVSPSAIARIDRTRRNPSSTVVSSGSAVRDDQPDQDDYPAQPKRKDGQRYQPCVICAMPLQTLNLTKRAWNAHVDQDIEPYVCISEDCIEPPQYFASSKDWMDHMQTRHSMRWTEQIHTERWHCDVNHNDPSRELPEFDEKAEFLEHLHTCHGEKLTQSQILGRIRRNRRIATRDPFVCPLCDCVPTDVARHVRQGEKPHALLWEHVAQHLKSMAFLSLSYVGDDVQDNESIADSSTQASSKNDAKISEYSLSDSSHRLHCDRDSCDCDDREKDSALDWSSLEATFESMGGIPEGQLPTSHADPRHDDAGTNAGLEWEFWYPLSLPPDCKQIGLPELGHAEDMKLMGYFRGYQRIRLANDEYTVAWICVIPAEYTAGKTFLDKQHGKPEDVSAHDNNDYTLGSIGEHNIIIALLPSHDFGVSSADKVIRSLAHSFPSVRICLMVGIGGGAPTQKHDIRLGDIVVGATSDGQGGVLHHDLGQIIQRQTHQPTDLLQRPPMVLRAAVSGLQAQYEEKGHRFEQAIKAVLEDHPRLRRKFQRPEPATDKLFKSDVAHNVSWTRVCSDDQSNLVSRPRRIDKGGPTIHYGSIFSADQLIEGASLRDRIAAEHDVLGFEMEAAGLMTNVPFLVIRGISDYCDSHRNKEWQGYAAMAAAAYAKDLLCRIPVDVIKAEMKIGDIFASGKFSSLGLRDAAFGQASDRDQEPIFPTSEETTTHRGPGVFATRYSSLPLPWKQDDELGRPTMRVHLPDGTTRSINDDDFIAGAGPYMSSKIDGSSSVLRVLDNGYQAASDFFDCGRALLPGDMLDVIALQRHLGLEPNDGKSVAQVLHSELRKSRVPSMIDQRPEDEQDQFLPINALYKILDTTSVASLMRELSPDATSQQLQLKVDEITGGHDEYNSGGRCRRRILGILLFSKRLDGLNAFIEDDIWDEDLPILRQGDSTDCRTRSNPERINKTLFRNWELNDMLLFDAYQYMFHVPFFDLRDDGLCSYELSPKIRLPWNSLQKVYTEGGCTLYRVEIHSAHHNYGVRKEPLYFTLKEFGPVDHGNVMEELAIYEKRYVEHQRAGHIIKLLLTFKHGRHHYLMFEWADGTLDDFWESRLAKRPPDAERWAAEQCRGLATALKQIHAHDTWQTKRRGGDAALEKWPGWGRHGDIKPKNILWFSRYREHKDYLVLSDLGLQQHFTTTRSTAQSAMGGVGNAYRAPELDLHQPLSRKSDIWSLGCVFLEFCIWYHMGYDGVAKFEDERLEHDTTDIHNLKEAKFFILETDFGSGLIIAKVNPAVEAWIKDLRNRAARAGSPFLQHTLELIETKMLVVDARDRQPTDLIRFDTMHIANQLVGDAESAASLPASPTLPVESGGDLEEVRTRLPLNAG